MSDEKNYEKDSLFTDEEILDHDYDGIKEMNNGMPFWVTWLFLGSIMFALLYSLHYFTGSGPTQAQEYQDLMATHKQRMQQQAGAVSEEELYASLNNPQGLDIGKAVFISRCAACHGQLAEGGIGPNLVDNYWLHGDGSVKAIAKVTAEGVTEKGMPAWGQMMSQKEVIATSYYIASLLGSTPPNAKAPQGEKVP